ncbi:MAG: hypothetical protein ACK59A_16585 [Cyanobacteriota bacterium]
MARVIRETGAEAASGDGVAIRRRFHSHQPGPAGSAAELPQRCAARHRETRQA